VIKKDFFKSSLVYTVSSGLSTIASFLLLPFYTNTHLLTVADYGALSLYLGLSLLVQLVTAFGLDYYVVVSYHELSDKPAELKSKVATLNGYLITVGAIIALSFAIGGHFLIEKFIENPNPASFRYIMMSVFTGIFNAHFRFYNNLLIQQGRPRAYFWSNLLNFATTIIFSLGILKMFPLTLEGPMWGRFLSCLCIFIISFGDVTFAYGIAFHRKFLKSAWLFCAPLMVTTFFQWVLSYSDRYIIKPLLFNGEVAIFDLAVRFTMLVSLVLDSLTTAITPKIFGFLKKGDKDSYAEINKYYSGFNIVALVLIPLNILILPIILPLFIKDEKYLTAFLYFGIIAAGLITRSIQNLFLFPVFYLKKTSLFIPINGISAVFQVVLGYLMVKHFKLYGAAFALNIVKILMLGLYFYFCRDLINEKLNKRKMVLLPIVVLLVISFSELFITEYGLKMHLVHLMELLAIAGVTGIIYWKEILELMKWGVKEGKTKLYQITSGGT
jgi:O-antigen/teichoic acid export membrane protein